LQQSHAEYTSTESSCQVGLASWNAAAHQAWKIWNKQVWNKATQTNIPDPAPNAPQPVIFTIGFDHSGPGIEAPDLVLLQMIANDPSSPVKFSNVVKGKAYLSSSADAVGQAFSEIASAILRLSQ